ncbi:Hemopexin [Streptomyces netropsis]|uniref:Hemopexin n=1 Tax=Streptomyces syringium TaxID=76729 RepID=A0ABS4YAS2_9ACTN|nr:hemopexin repeat-containing protein [Streptomyces syringium]MBP2405878.1 hypothetical protein [Streptomyces syringium]SPE64209.1 Hemopexin [Streptomyces netropsis]
MIQAATNRNNDTVYFFRGDQYVAYNNPDSKITSGPSRIADAWPGLEDTQFASDLDAGATQSPAGRAPVAYLFRGDQYLRYDLVNDRVVSGPHALADWPGLKKAGFDRDLDAAVWGAHKTPPFGREVYRFHFFKGDQYIEFDDDNNQLLRGPMSIADAWPGLKKAGFDRDLDSVFTTSSWSLRERSRQYLYFTRGDQYLRYDYYGKQVLEGPETITEGLPGLKGTEFATAESLPSHPTVVAHADCTFTFSNPGEGEPEPYGKIWLKTKSGNGFRLWTQANASVPTVTTASLSVDLPFSAADITEVCATVDESDFGNGDDYLARGSKPFTGNGTYTLTADDGSVTVSLTIT